MRFWSFWIVPAALVFPAVMVVAPVAALAVYGGGSAWAEVLGDAYMWNRAAWTVWQAAVSAAAVLVLGVPVGWVLARLAFPGRGAVLRLLMLPFVMPTLVAAAGVLALFGEHGLLWRGSQDTPWLLLYGNVFFNLPVMVRAAYQGFAAVPESRIQTALSLGADRWRCFWFVELPSVRAWLAAGMCLVFLYCFSGFGLALLLGGNDYATVEVEIFRLVAYELDMQRASVLVWLVLGVTALAGAAYAVLGRGTAGGRNTAAALLRRPSSRAEYGLLAGALSVLFLCCVLPLAAVLVRAAAAGSSWSVLAEEAVWAAVWNTLRFSVMAVAAAVCLGAVYAAAARKVLWLRGAMFLPFMVSPVCVAFGILLLYPQWTASLSLLVATYALLAYPFVAKDVLAAWDALPESYAAAARSMGAGRVAVARLVLVPLLRPALRRGLSLAAATCVGEFAATLFLSRPEWTTLTTLIYAFLGRAGADNYEKAMVLTVVLMGLALCVFLLAEGCEEAV